MEISVTPSNLELVLQTPEETRALLDGMTPSEKAELSADWLAQIQSATSSDPWLHGFTAISEFPKGRKYLISLSFRGKASVRPAQVGGFDVNIVIHGSTAVRGRGDLVAYRWALWKLTAPWTHRTRPPHLGKRCAFSTSSTGPFPSNHSRKTPKGPKIALGNPDRPGFTLIQRARDAVLGNCGFKGPPTADGVVEIAYGIAPYYQGNGYATEAARALVSYAFRNSKVRTVRVHTRPEPNASLDQMWLPTSRRGHGSGRWSGMEIGERRRIRVTNRLPGPRQPHEAFHAHRCFILALPSNLDREEPHDRYGNRDHPYHL